MYHGGVPETAFFRAWSRQMRGDSGNEADAGPSRTPLIHEVKVNKAKLEEITVPTLICGSWSDQGLHSKGTCTIRANRPQQFSVKYTEITLSHALLAMTRCENFFCHCERIRFAQCKLREAISNSYGFTENC
jgi:hypothetical protein